MEPRFGCDFSGVRVYSNEGAARSAREIAANAYTVGHNIVFGAGQLDPSSGSGRRLLAHELTHVIQQSGGGMQSLQRDTLKAEAKDNDTAKQAAPAQPDPGTAYFHIVVRDKGLDLGGGVLVSDLSDAKAKLMKRKIDKPWTLVLAIHASENRLGAQSPPDWQKNAIFYDESDVKKVFRGDSAFVAWRNQFGPNRVVLYGCQVTASFEQTIADNLARGGKAPSATGLGEGCKPLATTLPFGVNSRREYDKLADTEKEKMLGELQAANQTWGYYGGPPVPNDHVLDYLFNGPSPGAGRKWRSLSNTAISTFRRAADPVLEPSLELDVPASMHEGGRQSARTHASGAAQSEIASDGAFCRLHAIPTDRQGDTLRICSQLQCTARLRRVRVVYLVPSSARLPQENAVAYIRGTCHDASQAPRYCARD